MRVLVTATRGAGHFGPVAPFAVALSRAGHDVLAAVPEESIALAKRIQLATCVLPGPSREDAARLFRALRSERRDHVGRALVRELFGRVGIPTSLPHVRELIAAFHPDLVLRESFHYASALAAQEAGVRHARVASGMVWIDRLALAIAAEGYPALHTVGEAIERSPMLTLAPPSFDGDPRREPPVLRRYRDIRVHPTDEPVWRSSHELPLVYVTFGSLAPSFPFFPALLEATFAALATLPVDAIISVGERADPARVGEPPSNVRIERWVSQAEVLSQAAAVICHAGFGTLLGAVQAGVPIVLLPTFSDQPRNAARVEALGAGIVLGRDQRTASHIAGALNDLFQGGSYRTAARRLATEIATLPPADQAVTFLEQMVTGGRTDATRGQEAPERHAQDPKPGLRPGSLGNLNMHIRLNSPKREPAVRFGKLSMPRLRLPAAGRIQRRTQ